MNALILGCGYLGKRVASRWIDAGVDVAALTRSTDRADDLRRAGITPLIGDVTDPASLDALPTADVVLYAVGFDRSSGVDRREVVVEGLSNTLTALAGKTSRLIFISTTSVYGQSQGEWIDEDSPPTPASAAGRIALDAEALLNTFSRDQRERSRRSRLNVVVLRLSGLYGPGRLLRRVEQLRSGEPIAGDGDAWLNLIHVDDAASAVLRAAESPEWNPDPSPWGEGSGVRGGPVRPIAPDEQESDRPFRTTSDESQTDPLTPGPSPQGERGTARLLLVSDDRPVRRRDYYGRLAELTGAPPPVFDPSVETRAAGLGKRCRNARMKHALDLTLRYPTYEEGLADALEASRMQKPTNHPNGIE